MQVSSKAVSWPGRQAGSPSICQSHLARSNWNLEVLVFEERKKKRVPGEKPLGARTRTTQQIQPTYDAESGNRTRATLVGGECSHHCTCAIPAPSKEWKNATNMPRNVTFNNNMPKYVIECFKPVTVQNASTENVFSALTGL